jgi:hypothetical protein
MVLLALGMSFRQSSHVPTGRSNWRVCVALQLTLVVKKGNSPVLRSGSVSVSSGTELRVCVSRMFFRNF